MRQEFNYEEILNFVKENNITNPGQLRVASSSSYRHLYKRKLLEEVFPDCNRIQTDEEKYEEILEYVKNNEITGRRELQLKKSAYYNFLYHHKLLDKVFGETNRKGRPAKSNSNGMPLKPLLVDYFIKWAEQEHTTVEQQARFYGYLPQWISYCEDNHLDINTGKQI